MLAPRYPDETSVLHVAAACGHCHILLWLAQVKTHLCKQSLFCVLGRSIQTCPHCAGAQPGQRDTGAGRSQFPDYGPKQTHVAEVATKGDRAIAGYLPANAKHIGNCSHLSVDAQVRTPTLDGRTPILLAAAKGHYDMVRLLYYLDPGDKSVLLNYRFPQNNDTSMRKWVNWAWERV